MGESSIFFCISIDKLNKCVKLIIYGKLWGHGLHPLIEYWNITRIAADTNN